MFEVGHGENFMTNEGRRAHISTTFLIPVELTPLRSSCHLRLNPNA